MKRRTTARRRPNVIATYRQPGVDALAWLELNNPDLFRKQSKLLARTVAQEREVKP